MPDTIPVFVNERRVEIPRGGTAAMAAAQLDPALVGSPITDARGLSVEADAVLASGAILRVAASARKAGAPDADA